MVHGPSRDTPQNASLHQGVAGSPHPARGGEERGREQRGREGQEGDSPLPGPAQGRGAHGRQGLRKDGPPTQPHEAAPLTEDDDEPHHEGQAGKDQAPFTHGLIVWSGEAGWVGYGTPPAAQAGSSAPWCLGKVGSEPGAGGLEALWGSRGQAQGTQERQAYRSGTGPRLPRSCHLGRQGRAGHDVGCPSHRHTELGPCPRTPRAQWARVGW